MKKPKILLTGGSGRLGTELLKLLSTNNDIEAPSHQELDITQSITLRDYNLVIHAAAYTNVAEAENNIAECYKVNLDGTQNLLQAYQFVPFVFISTEYAPSDKNVYSRSKHEAEMLVAKHPNHLIIRTLFKPRPWPFEYAYTDQYTLGDYVDVIAKLIVNQINFWMKQNFVPSLEYVGTGRKTMFELARQTKPNVKPNSVYIAYPPVPEDYI